MKSFPQRRRAFVRTALLISPVALAFCLPSPFAYAADKPVKTADEAKAALKNAQPGDTIVLENGDYDLGKVTLMQTGTETAPLVVRAKTGGKARLVGKTGFVVSRAAYVTLSGLDFATEDISPVEMQGSHHIRVTENRFHIKEPGEKGTFRWVRIAGANSHHNRIDHNQFEEKHTIGNFVSIDGNGKVYPDGQISQYDRIDHNRFRNIGPRVPNGMEAIRVGLSGLSLSRGYTVIEDNLFEGCDGDPEVVSIKTSDAVIQNNVFRACQGGLCLRHGNRNRVIGNQFYGDGKMGSNGIRAYGDDHVIENNYFDGLTQFALAITNGDADYGADTAKNEPLPVPPGDADKLLKLHLRPQRITLKQNTVVHCQESIVLGAPYNLPAPQLPARKITFANNTIVGADTPDAKLIWIRTLTEDLVWRDNTIFAGAIKETGLPESTPASGVKIVRGASPKIAVPKPPEGIAPTWLK